MFEADFPDDIANLSFYFSVKRFNFNEHIHIGIFIGIPSRPRAENAKIQKLYETGQAFFELLCYFSVFFRHEIFFLRYSKVYLVYYKILRLTTAIYADDA